MALAPVGYKRILSMSWDEAAVDAAACGNGQLSELLTIASQAWHDITDADHETDAGCNCHVMRGETCSSCMRKYAAEDTHHGRRPKPLSDPDGAPLGYFPSERQRRVVEARMAHDLEQAKRSASLWFIHQPAKSLREELRLGADVHEDR